MWHHSNKGNKSVKFTDDSIKCCICFIEFKSSINNIAIADDPSHVREYYSAVINSLSQISIIRGISQNQIMKKPVDKKLFTQTVKKLLH
ncbi:MAG: hypothetical protein ACXWFZ_10240 [Nitrososphaeraceae archaeon]